MSDFISRKNQNQQSHFAQLALSNARCDRLDIHSSASERSIPMLLLQSPGGLAGQRAR
jgi:hypothetical protein